MARILLIEDNELNRDMLRRRLERKGYAVTVAEDGTQGLAAAKAESPDLVLMDIRLPDLDGREVTPAAQGRRGDASRAGDRPDRPRHGGRPRRSVLAAGCDDYDTKPVDFPRLLGKIEALLHAPGQGNS